MKPGFGLLLLLSTAAMTQVRPVRQPRELKRYTIEQFLGTVSYFGASFSPDEKWILFSSNKSGIFNGWRVPVGGGAAEQLTRSSKDSTFMVGYFPRDARVLFSRDQGGNENSHLFVLQADGTERELTPGAKVRAQFQGWSRDEKSFFISTNERDPRFFDLYQMDAATYERKMLFTNPGGFLIGPVAGDGSHVALVKPNTTADQDIHLYGAATKEIKHLTQHSGDVNFSPQTFNPESTQLYYTTDEGSEFAYVSRYELATGKKETVERANWDIMTASFSHRGKYRVIATNEDARTRVKILDSGGKPVELPNLPDGDITNLRISRSENLMAFYVNGDRSPGNLHVYDFRSKKVTRLTESLNPEVNMADLVEAKIIRYRSFDGLEIPALLFKPHDADSENKAPALVMVHGGPGGQARKGYRALVQFLVNNGYVVLDVNNRGSSGYGKTFFTADDRKHGREPLWDCVEAKKYLASLGYVDTAKIGIIGGSYGGYMVLAALTLKPTEFAAGVDIFGISNWVRTLESMPPYWESFRKALYTEIGDPQKDRDMLLTISPLFNADKIVRPLMVLQGANDPRVIKVESDDIVAAVRKKGGVAEYIVFADEGHGFTKKANEIQAYKGIVDFLDKYLKGS